MTVEVVDEVLPLAPVDQVAPLPALYSWAMSSSALCEPVKATVMVEAPVVLTTPHQISLSLPSWLPTLAMSLYHVVTPPPLTELTGPPTTLTTNVIRSPTALGDTDRVVAEPWA